MLLWSGQLISVLGSRISQISLPLLILALTRSPAQAGTVAALLGLPYLLFGLLAGVLIDRWDRKRTMLACEAINGTATATIPLALWTGHFSMPQLYLVALVTGTAFVFFNVAEIAALPSIVTAGQLPVAVGQNQATFSVGGVVGPPLAGLLFQLARPQGEMGENQALDAYRRRRDEYSLEQYRMSVNFARSWRREIASCLSYCRGYAAGANYSSAMPSGSRNSRMKPAPMSLIPPWGMLRSSSNMAAASSSARLPTEKLRWSRPTRFSSKRSVRGATGRRPKRLVQFG